MLHKGASEGAIPARTGPLGCAAITSGVLWRHGWIFQNYIGHGSGLGKVGMVSRMAVLADSSVSPREASSDRDLPQGHLGKVQHWD